jgi:hypothetical protein
LRAQAVPARQLDGFIDRRMRRDAVQPENLVQAQAQQHLQPLLLGAPRRPPRHQPVQRRLPAHHAVGEFLAQAPVRRGERRAPQFRLEQVFHISAARAPQQDAHRNFSWILSVHAQ